MNIQTAPAEQYPAGRVAQIDTNRLAGELGEQGFAVLEKLLPREECVAIASLYPNNSHFRSRIVMDRHGFGKGEYKYLGIIRLTPAPFLEDNVSPLPLAESGSEMKQDMDLLRQILLEVESWDDLGPRAVIINDVGEIKLNRGVEMLYDSGYIEGIASSMHQGQYKRIAVRDLSMKGHDFLNSIRDQDVWNKTKKEAYAAGGFTIEPLADLAKGFIKKKIEDHTGIKL